MAFFFCSVIIIITVYRKIASFFFVFFERAAFIVCHTKSGVFSFVSAEVTFIVCCVLNLIFCLVSCTQITQTGSSVLRNEFLSVSTTALVFSLPPVCFCLFFFSKENPWRIISWNTSLVNKGIIFGRQIVLCHFFLHSFFLVSLVPASISSTYQSPSCSFLLLYNFLILNKRFP